MRRQLLWCDMRQGPATPQIQAGIQLHQVAITCLVLRQQNHRRGRARALAQGARDQLHVNLAADDGLHPRLRRQHRKLQRGEKVVGICHRHGGYAPLSAQGDQRFDRQSPLKQRMLGVDAKVQESGVWHGRRLGPRRPRWQGRAPAHCAGFLNTAKVFRQSPKSCRLPCAPRTVLTASSMGAWPALRRIGQPQQTLTGRTRRKMT
jgi:hypothetical protein